MLVGRQEQKKILQEALSSDRSELVVIYGRRRVGKTYLIKQILGRRIDFEMTGIEKGNLKEQLENFNEKLFEVGFDSTGLEKPRSWQKAFSLLKRHLATKKSKKKKVIFLDELPWLATPKSKFLGMLGHFWNDWAFYNNVLLVVCGSAASWMVSKVLNDKGSLHNRVTQYMPLQPFTLAETATFLKAKKITANPYQVIQLYMALGGIPYYLEMLRPSESIPQNIDRLCFDSLGFLREEFTRLYRSLFDKADNHIAIVKALASKWKGLTRKEIATITGIPNGGGLTRILEELEKSAFIRTWYSFGNKKKGTLYRLTDNFSLFYLKLMSKRNLRDQKGVFLKLFSKPEYQVWCGYAFENICLIHHQQIAKALGIEYILHEFSSYLFTGNKDYTGIQIDLLIDRADGVINLCEVKFYNSEYVLTAAYKKSLRARVATFAAITNTRKSVLTTLVTTYGLINQKAHLDVVQNVVTIEDLFK